MLFPKSLLALLAVNVFGAMAQEDPAAAAADEPGFSAPDAAPLNADIKAVFPDSDILGIKLVNGRPTNAVIEVDNHEEGGIQVAFVSGNLLSTKPQAEDAPSWKSIVRNLTAVQYNVQVPAGEKRSLPFSFAFDAMPQDVTVQLNAVVISDKGNIFQVPVFEDKAAIVDPPVSFLDPQIIFLYLVLSGVFAGAGYVVYKTWIETLFPQTKRSGAKPKTKKVEAAPEVVDTAAATGVDGKSYDESWIPDHHINRPSAKRVKSGASAKGKKE